MSIEVEERVDRTRVLTTIVRSATGAATYKLLLRDEYVTGEPQNTYGPKLVFSFSAVALEDWPTICAAVEELQAEWKKRFDEKETKHARRRS